jgi:hypothetical protein
MVIKAQVLAGGRGLGHFENGFKGGVHVGVKVFFVIFILNLERLQGWCARCPGIVFFYMILINIFIVCL